jgi:putative ABC transport system permease protein
MTRVRNLFVAGLRRDLGPLVVGGLGMTLGVASLVFFLMLGGGVKDHVVGDLIGKLPIGTLEVKVTGGSALLGFLSGPNRQKSRGPTISETKLEKLRALAGVEEVVERVRVDFPIVAWGLQEELKLPRPVAVDAFATGLPPEWVADDIVEGERFADPGEGKPVPVLLSSRLIAMANSALAATLKIDITPKMISGLSFDIVLNRSFMTGGMKTGGKRRRIKGRIVGISDKAITLGFSVPSAVAERWNREFGRDARPVDGAWVRLDDPSKMGAVTAQIDRLGLDVDEGPRVVGAVIDGAMAALVLIAGLLLLLAALIVSQTFYTRVAVRRAEYGLYRALGASRSLLLRLVMGEAALVGLLCGLLGSSLGYFAGQLAEREALALFEGLPVKPTALVIDDPWVFLVGLGVAVGFSLLGALRPAVRAARIDPARALGLG